MSSPIPQSASAFALSGVRTGRPVATGGLSRLADEIGFVCGYNLTKCGEVYVKPRPASRVQLEGLSHSVHVPYARSPGAQVVRVTVELQDSNELGDSQTITATLPTGASWIEHNGLDGSRTFYNPPQGRTAPREIVGWVDVSGVTAGALTSVITLASTASAKGAGIRRVAVHESPLGGLAIDASEPGWDAAACRAGRLVVDGGSSSPRGTQRLFHCLDKGRAGFKQHLLIGDIESANTAGASSTPHWSREANTWGEIDWLTSTGTVTETDPCWYLPMRVLYGSAGDAAVFSMRIRYRTSNGTSCGVRMVVESGAITSGAWVGTGTTSTISKTLAGTSNVWAWESQSASLPVDGTDGLVRVYFEAQGPGTGQLLSLATLGLLGNDS